MIIRIRDFLRAHFNDIMLFIIVVFLIMLAFAVGYITAKYQSKTPIIIENIK
jgi:capsular polysaccharide biosynthesis protein